MALHRLPRYGLPPILWKKLGRGLLFRSSLKAQAFIKTPKIIKNYIKTKKGLSPAFSKDYINNVTGSTYFSKKQIGATLFFKALPFQFFIPVGWFDSKFGRTDCAFSGSFQKNPINSVNFFRRIKFSFLHFFWVYNNL